MENIENQTKPKRKTPIIIGIIFVIAVFTAGVLYIYLYKIPHDEAITKYNESVTEYNNVKEKYDAAVNALEDRNKELDNSISSLSQFLSSDSIPIDESMLEEPTSILEEVRKVQKDSAPTVSEMPATTNDINKENTKKIQSVTEEIIAETSKITELISEVQAMGEYSSSIELLSTAEEQYQTMIDQFKGSSAELVWFNVNKQSTLLRFLVQITNPNSYSLRGGYN